MELHTLPAFWLDLILVFTLLEWLALALWRRFGGGGLGPAELALGILPGLLLMLALRLAAPDQVPVAVYLCCALAGLVHAWDFVRRSARALPQAAAAAAP